MHILVDGYNFVRCTPLARAERGGLEHGRMAVLNWLSGLRKRGHQITVVFDGSLEGAPAPAHQAGVRVHFAPSADAAIARMARPGMFVISSDREVQREAERAGAVACSSEEFWRHAEPVASDGHALASAPKRRSQTGAAGADRGEQDAANEFAEKVAADDELEVDWTQALDDPRFWTAANEDAGGEPKPRPRRGGRRLSRQESRRRAYLARL